MACTDVVIFLVVLIQTVSAQDAGSLRQSDIVIIAAVCSVAFLILIVLAVSWLLWIRRKKARQLKDQTDRDKKMMLYLRSQFGGANQPPVSHLGFPMTMAAHQSQWKWMPTELKAEQSAAFRIFSQPTVPSRGKDSTAERPRTHRPASPQVPVVANRPQVPEIRVEEPSETPIDERMFDPRPPGVGQQSVIPPFRPVTPPPSVPVAPPPPPIQAPSRSTAPVAPPPPPPPVDIPTKPGPFALPPKVTNVENIPAKKNPPRSPSPARPAQKAPSPKPAYPVQKAPQKPTQVQKAPTTQTAQKTNQPPKKAQPPKSPAPQKAAPSKITPQKPPAAKAAPQKAKSPQKKSPPKPRAEPQIKPLKPKSKPRIPPKKTDLVIQCNEEDIDKTMMPLKAQDMKIDLSMFDPETKPEPAVHDDTDTLDLGIEAEARVTALFDDIFRDEKYTGGLTFTSDSEDGLDSPTRTTGYSDDWQKLDTSHSGRVKKK